MNFILIDGWNMLRMDGKDVDDLTGKMVELVGTSIPIGVTESGVSTFDVLA